MLSKLMMNYAMYAEQIPMNMLMASLCEVVYDDSSELTVAEMHDLWINNSIVADRVSREASIKDAKTNPKSRKRGYVTSFGIEVCSYIMYRSHVVSSNVSRDNETQA